MNTSLATLKPSGIRRINALAAQHPAMGVDLIEASPAAAEVFAIADEVRPGCLLYTSRCV